MVRKLTIILFAISLLTYCCKEDEQIIEFPSLIGHWDITQIDSCMETHNYSTLPWIIDSFQDTGSIVFNEDKTGYFVYPIRSITCGETNFEWEHVKIDSRILLTLSNGFTRCYIKTFKKDTLEFYLREYCINLGGIGGDWLYYMKLIKTN